MSMTPSQQQLLRDQLTTAIAVANADAAAAFLKAAPQAPARLLGERLHDILDAPPHSAIAGFRNSGSHINGAHIPPTAASYEHRLFLITRKLVEHGADLTVTDEYGNTPAQRCFDNANDDRGYPHKSTTRWYACTEMVRATLLKNPEWKPDYNKLFTSLFYKPEDREAAEHRRDIARWANTMGYHTSKWLHANTPAATALRLCMSADSKAFWSRNDGKHCDPDVMPWMDHGRLQGEALQRALGASGITFATGAPAADSVIAKAQAAARNGRPPTAG